MAKILKLNRKTVNSYYNEFRELILENSLRELEGFELDESYGVHWTRGKRSLGAAGKTLIFGLLKKNGKVFVTVVPNEKS